MVPRAITRNRSQMSKVLYFLAALLLLGWLLGFLVFGLGVLVHLLLLAAVVVVIIEVIKE